MKEHICKRCGKWHSLFYRIHEGGQEHLVYKCAQTNESFYIQYVAGLPIPHLKAQKILNNERKAERARQQPTLDL